MGSRCHGVAGPGDGTINRDDGASDVTAFPADDDSEDEREAAAAEEEEAEGGTEDDWLSDGRITFMREKDDGLDGVLW
jgi:hypothetical protein